MWFAVLYACFNRLWAQWRRKIEFSQSLAASLRYRGR